MEQPGAKGPPERGKNPRFFLLKQILGLLRDPFDQLAGRHDVVDQAG